MGNKSKKQRIVYKDDPQAKAKELEQFLFGAPGETAQLFARQDDDEDELEALAAVRAKQGDSLAFFEDRAGGEVSDEFSESEDSQPSGSEQGEDGSSSEDDEDEQAGTRGQAAWADAAAESDDQAPGSSGAGAEQQGKQRRAGQKSGGRQPVWEDPADADLKVNVADKSMLRKLRQKAGQKVLSGDLYEAALRKQHSQLHPRTAWATEGGAKRNRDRSLTGFGADSDEEEAGTRGEQTEEGNGAVEDLLLSATPLLGTQRGSGRKLPPGTLELSRLKDANQHEPNQSVVRSVEWHPAGQLLMTAGLDKRIRLFQVDGARNPKVQSIFMEDCPVQKAGFANGGSQIIAVGRRPHLYLYDIAASRVERVWGPAGYKMKSLESFAVTQGSEDSTGPAGPLAAFLGDQGFVPLMSLKSRQWIGNLKMSGTVRSATFSSDGMQLLTSGGDGIVHTWDMRTRRCVGQMVDFGNKDSASLAVSQNNRYIATGSASGVVNVYNRDHCFSSSASKAGLVRPVAPTPLREIMNLTTAADTLAFSPDAQILAIASRLKRDALRLVHLPSCTVFQNWPTARSPIHYVHSLAFSPNGGFLAIGNAKGRVLLYRLHHYSEA